MTIFADHLARRRAGAHAPQILQTVWGYRERRGRRRSSITSSTHKKWRHSEKPAEDKLYDARSSLRRKGSGSDQYPTAITEDQAGPAIAAIFWRSISLMHLVLRFERLSQFGVPLAVRQD